MDWERAGVQPRFTHAMAIKPGDLHCLPHWLIRSISLHPPQIRKIISARGHLDPTKSRSSKRVLGLGLKSVVRSFTPSISSQSFNTQLPASHEFSADSRTVLIWTEAELAVYSIERGLGAIVPLRGIRYSSAGAEKFGLVLTEGEVSDHKGRLCTQILC
jgi:hypothetical protein